MEIFLFLFTRFVKLLACVNTIFSGEYMSSPAVPYCWARVRCESAASRDALWRAFNVWSHVFELHVGVWKVYGCKSVLKVLVCGAACRVVSSQAPRGLFCFPRAYEPQFPSSLFLSFPPNLPPIWTNVAWKGVRTLRTAPAKAIDSPLSLSCSKTVFHRRGDRDWPRCRLGAGLLAEH